MKDFEVEEKYRSSTRSPPMNTNTQIPKTSFERSEIHNLAKNMILAVPSTFSGDLDELEERVKSMMEKSQNRHANEQRFADRCKVCGKEGKGSAIKDHIEANHLEGIVIPCNLCDKTFRYRNGFRKRKTQHQNIMI